MLKNYSLYFLSLNKNNGLISQKKIEIMQNIVFMKVFLKSE